VVNDRNGYWGATEGDFSYLFWVAGGNK